MYISVTEFTMKLILGGTVLLDFESAALAAFGDVFPEAQVKGCLFHYSQAVQRNIGRHGLETVYRRTPPYDAPEFADVYRWARRLTALAVTPVRFLRVDNCLTNPPRTGDPLVDANLLAFRDYYLNQWLRNRDRALLWNHYDRDGPRTTNHAEGYHSGLSSLFDTRRKVPLGTFLGKMQDLHNEIRQRVKQLVRGAAPTPRKRQYIENDNNLQLAKDSLQQWLHINPNPQEDVLRGRLLRHLDRCQHLIG